MNHQKYRVIVPFLIVPLFVYTLFVIVPYAQSILISFTTWRGLVEPPQWNGLQNYLRLLEDANFWNALTNNVRYLVALPTITISLALVFAYVLVRRGLKLYRVIYFFPHVMSLVAVGVLWGFVFHPRLGIVNGVLRLLGLLGGEETIAWLGDPNLALGAIAAVIIWHEVGFHMVLFIAAIGSIPKDYFEAAMMDGANEWVLFWNITLPLLHDAIRTSFLFIAIGAFNMFAITQVMTQGGPNGATTVLATYLYDRAFTSSRFGYSAAIAVTMFLLMLLLSAAANTLLRRETVEY